MDTSFLTNTTTTHSTPPTQPKHQTKSRIPLHRRLKSHLLTPLPSSLPSASLLLLLTICTGIQDATTFPDYHCFASNQTGNTIFLTLAVILPSLNGKMFVTANIGVALALFLTGGWLTGQLGHILAPAPTRNNDDKNGNANRKGSGGSGRTRWFILLTNVLQTLLVSVAAFIQARYGVHLSSTPDLLVIGLLAFASGSQVVQSRSLAMTEISTAMATAAWVDLMIDPHLFSTGKGRGQGRNRRVMFLIALVVGGFVGAALYRWKGSAVAIAVSAGGKGVVCLGWMFVKGEEERGDEEAEWEAGEKKGRVAKEEV
jgi:uncharacterized membrane protein YoaK (UPF0700 family)